MIEERIIKPGLMKRLFRKTYPVKVELIVYDDEYNFPENIQVERYSHHYCAVKCPEEYEYDSNLSRLANNGRSKLDKFKSKFVEVRKAKVRKIHSSFGNASWSSVELYLPAEQYKVPYGISYSMTKDNFYEIHLGSFDNSCLMHRDDFPYKEFFSQFGHLLEEYPPYKIPRVYDDIDIKIEYDFIGLSIDTEMDCKLPAKVYISVPSTYRMPSNLPDSCKIEKYASDVTIVSIEDEITEVSWIKLLSDYNLLPSEFKDKINCLVDLIIDNSPLKFKES